MGLEEAKGRVEQEEAMKCFRLQAVSNEGCGKAQFSETIKNVSNSLSCCQALSLWARRGTSSLALFTRLTARATRPTSQPHPSTKPSPDVLPLPVALVTVSVPSLTQEHFQALLPDTVSPDCFPLLTDLVVGAVVALNCLYSVGWASNPIIPKSFGPLTNMQTLAICNVIRFCLDFINYSSSFSWAESFKDLSQKRVDYAGAAVSVRRNLVAKLVVAVWPKVGSACVCDITPFVDEHLKDDLNNPPQCVLGPEFWPPQPRTSKVYATDAEWYELCKAAFCRNMLQAVPEHEIFTDASGHKVLAGAMGVDKPKEVDGVMHMYLRFIAIIIPTKAYLRKMRGDSDTLPQAALLSILLVGDDEVAIINSEDLESCFNLFCMLQSWRGYFVFSKMVAGTALGLPSAEPVYVGMGMVPMGWLNSGDIIQNFIRRFVFKTLSVNPEFEVQRQVLAPRKHAAVMCMDGFDLVSRVKVFDDAQVRVRFVWKTRVILGVL